MLQPEERSRYARHLLLPQLGEAGQLRLKEASVLVVGAGGLGTPMLQYLAAAGVGTLGIVDDDVVSLSNLHRQILFGTADVGRPKVDVAAEVLRRLNPHVKIEPMAQRLDRTNALDIIDVNGAMRILAERYGAPAKALKGEAEVDELQAQRAEQQAQQEAMAMEASMAQTRATQAGGLKDAAMAAETQMGAQI